MEEAHDVGGGLLVAIVKDFDGNMIGVLTPDRVGTLPTRAQGRSQGHAG